MAPHPFDAPNPQAPNGPSRASAADQPDAVPWLVLVYKVPPEPSRHRVALWRRLKEAGAVYLQNSVCILPDQPGSAQAFQALGQEIEAAGGEYTLLQAQAANPAEQAKIIARFHADRSQEYGEVVEQCEAFLEDLKQETARRNFSYAELEENEAGLERLLHWFRKVRSRDFFASSEAAAVEARLEQCRQALDEFAARVFAEQDRDSR